MKKDQWTKPDKLSFHKRYGEKYIYGFRENVLLIKSKLDPDLLVVGLTCKDLKTAKEIANLLEKS